ncbi:hypothetical protein KVR01_004683 [Diaporthe batatas]|uniref:uncharacterized protein n=1 Tax=Diaporthe batatas TaxID=748121 RepID=UPI001D0521F1|nr:uncharacterized protein KVR01_004683 [Diaporthe batatas]KAG8166131.1 hypothetical protein KVR01_004683 [Diaporthe batatas]
MDMLISNTGLTVVYEPESGFPVADIVLIHGLQGHPYKTWACKKSQSDFSSVTTPSVKVSDSGNGSRKSYDRVVPRFESSFAGGGSSQKHGDLSRNGKDAKEVSVFWPNDLLPVQYLNVRILVYGYDIRVINYFVGPINENSIHSHSKDLLSLLAAARRLDSPLVLIAHSLGGIIVKEMLAKSSASTDGRLKDVVASIASVIFLGTLHRGSRDLAILGDWVRSIISNALRMRINLSILNALRLKINDLEHFPAITINDCPEIVMEDHNYLDIVEFVRRRLGLGMTAKRVDQQAVEKKILEKSGGVFLWVSLVVEDIL